MYVRLPLVGAQRSATASKHVVETHTIDAIVAVDGGTNSIMFGKTTAV